MKEKLLAETQDVAARLNRLNAFMASDEFPKLRRAEKDLLYSQQRVMSKYVQILGKRLELIGQEFRHRSMEELRDWLDGVPHLGDGA